jgi:hypothetical protein
MPRKFILQGPKALKVQSLGSGFDIGHVRFSLKLDEQPPGGSSYEPIICGGKSPNLVANGRPVTYEKPRSTATCRKRCAGISIAL